MFIYPVKLTRLENGDVQAQFPDVPGALTCGEDEAQALERAPEALKVILADIIDKEEDLPQPSTPGPGQPVVDLGPVATSTLALYQTMRERGISKADLARILGVEVRHVSVLLDLFHPPSASKLLHCGAAFGRRLVAGLDDVA